MDEFMHEEEFMKEFMQGAPDDEETEDEATEDEEESDEESTDEEDEEM